MAVRALPVTICIWLHGCRGRAAARYWWGRPGCWPAHELNWGPCGYLATRREGVMNPYSKISTVALHGSDPAELGQLTATVERILPAIEKFWRYDGRDDAARRRPGWLARLDVPLPEAGGGIGAVVADLAEVVIPNGARVSEPGWSGFVTTGPTTSAVAVRGAGLQHS